MGATPEYQEKLKDSSTATSSTIHFQYVLLSFLLRALLSLTSLYLHYFLQQGISDNFSHLCDTDPLVTAESITAAESSHTD